MRWPPCSRQCKPSPDRDSQRPLVVSIASIAVTDGHVRYQDQRKQSEPGWLPPLNLEKVTLQAR
ncbi:hypothetical protein [Aeromonas ichthyocola]|uniref:hypothetical protein n=1 Tax=Aeromonas ichthyocola TaxID=3367746 RepID=UPI003F853B0A